jgi:cytochrome c oxidase assembly protein subunit 15
LTRRPFRRDLAILAWLLPGGVLAQAVLGGFTVREHLAPGFVMGHFGLSMLILIAAVALAWRATFEPGARPRTADRLAVWPVRGLAALGAVTIAAGTIATAAGPHAGGEGTHDVVPRLRWRGAETLNWAIHQHGALATLLGLAAVGVWFLLRARSADGSSRNAVTAVCVLVACQGLVGSAQYAMHLPAEIVWFHVVLAALTWLALVWATAAAGRLVPRRESVPAVSTASSRELARS